jgi:hypothetical protein
MDLLGEEASKEIRKTIELLRVDLADLESRLRGRPVCLRQGSLKNIGIRILVLAERIENLLSTLAAKEELNRAS